MTQHDKTEEQENKNQRDDWEGAQNEEMQGIEIDEVSDIKEGKTEIQEKQLSPEDEKLKDVLARTLADFENFKKRTQRDKEDMIFFLKSDILKKILPRMDDIERILKNTPAEMKVWPVYEGVVSIETKFKKDLESMGLQSFESKGQKVDPDKHDVMTTVPWQAEWIVFDEFEKGYTLWDRVLRHAKVVVGAGV